MVNASRTALGQDQVCIFKDMCDLGLEMAQCHTHQRLCPVPGCDVLVVGTSCKDLSKMSNTNMINLCCQCSTRRAELPQRGVASSASWMPTQWMS